MKNRYVLSAIAALALSSISVFAGQAPQGQYKIDSDHSNVGFEVNHMGISLTVGRFDKLAGDIQFIPSGDSKVSVEIDVGSVNTKIEQRDRHLRSDAFFNAASFPKMTFASTKITYDAAGNPTTIVGDLTLHGISKPVTLTVVPVGTGADQTGATRAGFKATATLKRSEYGMKEMLALIGDDIAITLNIEAVKQ